MIKPVDCTNRIVTTKGLVNNKKICAVPIVTIPVVCCQRGSKYWNRSGDTGFVCDTDISRNLRSDFAPKPPELPADLRNIPTGPVAKKDSRFISSIFSVKILDIINQGWSFKSQMRSIIGDIRKKGDWV